MHDWMLGKVLVTLKDQIQCLDLVPKQCLKDWGRNPQEMEKNRVKSGCSAMSKRPFKGRNPRSSCLEIRQKVTDLKNARLDFRTPVPSYKRPFA